MFVSMCCWKQGIYCQCTIQKCTEVCVGVCKRQHFLNGIMVRWSDAWPCDSKHNVVVSVLIFKGATTP